MREASLPEHPVPESDSDFDELGLAPEIRTAVDEMGLTHPTPIQVEVIPPALEGRDIVGLAETGSGKTAAFALPLVQRLGAPKGWPRALILSPTREITLQTKGFLDYFGASQRLRAVALVGGLNIRHQFDALDKKPDIVVATPGRLLDHVGRGTIRLDRVVELVLDEADHMLDLGFMPQIHKVLRELPEKRHTMMFSATMPPEIERLTRQFLTDPLRIDITPPGVPRAASPTGSTSSTSTTRRRPYCRSSTRSSGRRWSSSAGAPMPNGSSGFCNAKGTRSSGSIRTSRRRSGCARSTASARVGTGS